ncbi:MAG: hypothetical protein FWC08_13635 [Defluviitaleaceae bacterium]|nr:hypothetical protein [Defluviitaleaceae bacterium]
MEDIVLSLIIATAKSFFKEIAKALAKRLVSDKKERTAPICGRDGSGNSK